MISRLFLTLVLLLPGLATLGRAIACPGPEFAFASESAGACAPAPTSCCCAPMDASGASCGCSMESAPAAPPETPAPAPRPATSNDQLTAALLRAALVSVMADTIDAAPARHGPRDPQPPTTHGVRLAKLGVWRI